VGKAVEADLNKVPVARAATPTDEWTKKPRGLFRAIVSVGERWTSTKNTEPAMQCCPGARKKKSAVRKYHAAEFIRLAASC